MPTPSVIGGNAVEVVQGVLRVNNPNSIQWTAYVAVGASGAATVSQNGSTAAGPVTCVKNTTGIYDITFPVMVASATSLAHCDVRIALSAAATVAGAYVKAFSPTAGTAQIVTYLNTAGTPVEPASGDAFTVKIFGTHTGQF